MTNQQVIQAFLAKREGKSLNMHTDGTYLYSYNTVIAQHDRKIIVNMTRYSQTTSKQRGYLVRELQGIDYIKVDAVPMNTRAIHNFTPITL
jgi:hypothetical protein